MSIDGEIGGVISNEDIEHAAEALEPDSSAALLVWEDLWAKPLMEALLGANAVVLEGGRIVLDGTAERLKSNEDVKEFYLGIRDAGVRGVRRWKRRKQWR